jgi:hypothetical protein
VREKHIEEASSEPSLSEENLKLKI